MLEHEADIQDNLEEAIEHETTTTKPKRKAKKKQKPCVDCPDYEAEDALTQKIFEYRAKGYNHNQIAAMLGIHKQFVDGKG